MKAGLKADGRRYNKEIIDFFQMEDEKLQRFINTQSDLINDTLKPKNHLLELLLEDRKKKEIQITTLQQRLRAMEAPRLRPRALSSTAVVSVTQLFALLAQPTSQMARNFSYEVTFGHSNNHVEAILSADNTFDPQAQGLAQ
ncbi:hypothetical protein F9C07_2233800 [Aspergillus flavus]|uniref:Uncharacterized protein n=2 Tax=Aspergillus subgen. Circumdati TaxID=2720871 RepID=A0A7U2MHE8_ASPFN|nr:hypothetical protein Ao3042_03102 [Aspergillus oryzae 3.042]KDE80948.1 hypothetical protein AO1008_07049 [Aspergillus oryzae 100-8]QRD83794.1 hypothetical protein F9C07_2233800 [Aspergillus flavus]|eukprot:EIT80747.1 hypothetical protein Ao3042_03102 [Aspergillus oryzae 3.042]